MTRRHWMAIDFVVASFVALFCLLAGVPSRTAVTHPTGLLPSLALAAAVFLAIGLRRRGPMAAFWTLAAVALIVVRWPAQLPLESVTLLSMAYVLYLVTVACARRTSVLALAVSLA